MKKDFKNHPFKKRDKVYYPLAGEGSVIQSFREKVKVLFKDGGSKDSDLGISFLGKDIALLSFTPYEINSNWERPFEPKEGDVVSSRNSMCSWISIFKEDGASNGYYRYHASLIDVDLLKLNDFCNPTRDITPASEEEKRQLFAALEKNGKRWNPDTMKVEDIPEPLKEGDLVIAWNGILSEEKENYPIIGTLDDIFIGGNKPFLVGVYYWENAVKFESMEQYEKIRRGEV